MYSSSYHSKCPAVICIIIEELRSILLDSKKEPYTIGNWVSIAHYVA